MYAGGADGRTPRNAASVSDGKAGRRWNYRIVLGMPGTIAMFRLADIRGLGHRDGAGLREYRVAAIGGISRKCFQRKTAAAMYSSDICSPSSPPVALTSAHLRVNRYQAQNGADPFGPDTIGASVCSRLLRGLHKYKFRCFRRPLSHVLYFSIQSGPAQGGSSIKVSAMLRIQFVASPLKSWLLLFRSSKIANTAQNFSSRSCRRATWKFISISGFKGESGRHLEFNLCGN